MLIKLLHNFGNVPVAYYRCCWGVYFLLIFFPLLQRPWAKSSIAVKQHDLGSRESSGEPLQLVWTIWLLAKYLSIFLQLMPMDSIQTYLLAPSLTLFLHRVIQGDCCAVVHSCPCSEASPCACPCLQQCSSKEYQPASTIKQFSAEINMSTGWDWCWKYLRVLHTPALGTKGTGPNQHTPLESIRTLKVTQGWWKHPHRELCGQVQISTEGCVHGSCLPKARSSMSPLGKGSIVPCQFSSWG